MEKYQTFLTEFAKQLLYRKGPSYVREGNIRALTAPDSPFWKYLDQIKKDNGGKLPSPGVGGEIAYYDEVTILGVVLDTATVANVEEFKAIPNAFQVWLKLDEHAARFLKESMDKAKDYREPFVIVSVSRDKFVFQGVSRVLLAVAKEMVLVQTY